MAEELASEIIDKIKAQAGSDKEISLDTELDELGIHSLELTEIVFDLEEAYGIEIDLNRSRRGTASRRSATSSSRPAR